MKLSFFFYFEKKEKKREWNNIKFNQLYTFVHNLVLMKTTEYSENTWQFFLDIIRQNHIELIHWCFTLYFIIISQYLNVLEVSQTNVLGILRTCSGAVSNGISFFFSLQFYRSTTPIRSGTAYKHVSTMIFQMHKQRVYSRSNKF